MVKEIDPKRSGRMHTLLKELGAGFIQQTIRHPDTLITVTQCRLGSNMRKATILVSVFPAESEQAVLQKLKKQKGAFKEFVKQNAKLRTIPYLDFDLDVSEKQRQQEGHIL